MVSAEVERATARLTDRMQRAFNKHRGSITAFLEQGALRAIVAVEPYGMLFAVPLFRYLREVCEVENLTLISIQGDGEGLDGLQVRGREVIVVDDDIITGTTYVQVMKVINSYHPTQILYLTWEDHLGLADVALQGGCDTGGIDAQVAAHKLGVHPDTFSRLCREGKVPGAKRVGKHWVIKKEDLDAFIKSYSPVLGRPKGSIHKP